MSEVKVSEAIASMIWTACAGGEPVEVTLFRDWLEAYHLARLGELRGELETAQAALHAAADALVAARTTAEERTAAQAEPAAEAVPSLPAEPEAEKKSGPWAVKKKRIMDRLEAALKRGVTRGQIAEASGGKLDVHAVMDFIDRKQKKVAEWDALAAALKKLEGVSGECGGADQ